MVDVSERDDMMTSTADPTRDWARARVEKRHKLRADVVAYVVINIALVVAWAATGLGYFWPGWVLGIWGVLLVLDAWDLRYKRPVTDAEIEEELRRSRR